MLIELETDDQILVLSSPELQKAIHRAVQMAIRNFRANPEPSILSANTVNGALGADIPEAKKLPMPDELQLAVEAGRKDPRDLCRTRS